MAEKNLMKKFTFTSDANIQKYILKTKLFFISPNISKIFNIKY